MAKVVELKAKAYDVLARIEQLQQILKQINAEILEEQRTPEPAPVNIEQIAKAQEPKEPKKAKPE